jgi:hypothetical protein
MRDHNGKTYLQVRASDIALQSSAGGTDAPSEPQRGSRSQPGDDLDDDIPFVTANGIW